MVALLMPFESRNQKIDDASFIKYLEVQRVHSCCFCYLKQRIKRYRAVRAVKNSQKPDSVYRSAAPVAGRHKECCGQWVNCGGCCCKINLATALVDPAVYLPLQEHWRVPFNDIG